MIRTESIRSLSDFRQQATTHLNRLAESGEAEVLTVNGEAKGVVMSPAAYDQLAELAHQAEITASIRRSMAEFEAGKGVPHPEGMHALAKELGIKLDR